MLKQKYFLTGIFILSAERQPIKLAWRKIVWLPAVCANFAHTWSCCNSADSNLHSLHQIHISQSRMLSADTCCGQHLRQLDRGAVTQYSRKPLFQFLMNDGGGEWQAIRFILMNKCCFFDRLMLLRYNMRYGVCKYLTKKKFIFSWNEKQAFLCG